MKVGIVGPIATDSIAWLLDGDVAGLPRGYPGAPLLGTLIGSLIKRGHVVTAFSTSSDLSLLSDKPVVAKGDRFRIVYCPARPRAFYYQEGHWGRAVDVFRLERDALRREILKDRPDVVHAHWTYEFAMAALDAGLPHVITCHDAPQIVLRYAPDVYRLVRYFMAKRVLAQASCLTAVSPYLKKMIEGYARVPVRVVPNPLPDGIIGSSDRIRPYDPKCPRIVMVLNGWGKRKNPQPALKAFGLLRQRIPGAELHIMGSDYGPGERAELWARSQGLAEGIHFLGSVPYLTLLGRLADSDLLLHPSLEETFGMSIVEAMALGVPVVGGEGSGAVPWVIGESGITTNVTSAISISNAMQRVLTDFSLHNQLAHDAKRAAHERFGSENIVNHFESIYAHVLRKN